MKKRIFLIVLDSFGIGAAPDARDFGDEGANTLGSLIKTGKLHVPNLTAMGLGCIDSVDGLDKVKNPSASYGRLVPVSRGKDTTVGHWELMGIASEKPFPTYPDGFPDEIISAFSRAVGRGVLCNKPYSGTDVIRDFGEEHLRSGDLIVYTSADSVFQIAAHENVVPTELLYKYCETARELLCGEHAVGRVIARPFKGSVGSFVRTSGRHDYSVKPPYGTALDKLKESGLDVISVGKISDIFASCGITESHPSRSNEDGMRITRELAERDFHGLCFVNLVDFDSKYGHRQDADGYALAISDFDRWLGEFKDLLTEDDLLIITADHGCDPSDDSTDHTRECVPLLVYERGAVSKNLGTLEGFQTVARTICKNMGIALD